MARLNINIDDADKVEFEKAVSWLDENLDCGRDLTRVMVAMVRCVIRTHKSGKIPVWPLECVTRTPTEEEQRVALKKRIATHKLAQKKDCLEMGQLLMFPDLMKDRLIYETEE